MILFNCNSYFRVSLILNIYANLTTFIYIIGFFCFDVYGMVLWTEKPSNIEEIEPMSAKKQILFALSVSLLNLHAIMDTVGVIGTSASVYDGYDKSCFFIGYNFCILIWFVFLAILEELQEN